MFFLKIILFISLGFSFLPDIPNRASPVPENGNIKIFVKDLEGNRSFKKKENQCSKVNFLTSAKLSLLSARGTCKKGYFRRKKQCIPIQHATNDEIRQLIISLSIASYPGNCPCPYFSDRAGRRCGRRSAYNRVGGYSPICYERDISDDEVQAFRGRHER